MNELALFAGSGGGILGGKLLGWSTIGAVEIAPYQRENLLARQRDGFLPRFPIWDNVKTFDGNPWRGYVDVVTGGFPCKGVSTTGPGGGLLHPDSALWHEQARIIREVMPHYALVENGPALTSRGLGTVLRDLAAMGYDAKWGVLSALQVGANHERERIWILATNPDIPQRKGGELSSGKDQKHVGARGCSWWQDKPSFHGVDDGTTRRVDRLIAIGNMQVPAVVRLAWQTLNTF